MDMTRKPSASPSPVASPSRKKPRGRLGAERGMSVLEVLISVSVLSVGLMGGAQLLGVSLQTHQLSRTTTDSSRLALEKVDQLNKLDFAADAGIQISPAKPDPLTQDVPNYFDTPVAGVTRRWQVQAGPTANTRRVTVRIVPEGSDLRLAKPVVVDTIVRGW